MVLCLKARESRSPPSLESLQNPSQQTTKAPPKSGAFCVQNTSARGGGVTVPAQRWHYCDRRSGTSSASMTRQPADYSLHRFGRVPPDKGSCRTDLVNEGASLYQAVRKLALRFAMPSAREVAAGCHAPMRQSDLALRTHASAPRPLRSFLDQVSRRNVAPDPLEGEDAVRSMRVCRTATDFLKPSTRESHRWQVELPRKLSPSRSDDGRTSARTSVRPYVFS